MRNPSVGDCLDTTEFLGGLAYFSSFEEEWKRICGTVDPARRSVLADCHVVDCHPAHGHHSLCPGLSSFGPSALSVGASLRRLPQMRCVYVRNANHFTAKNAQIEEETGFHSNFSVFYAFFRGSLVARPGRAAARPCRGRWDSTPHPDPLLVRGGEGEYLWDGLPRASLGSWRTANWHTATIRFALGYYLSGFQPLSLALRDG